MSRSEVSAVKNTDDNRMDEIVSERLKYMITGDEQVLWTGKTESYAKLKRNTIFIVVMLLIMGFLLYKVIESIIVFPAAAIIPAIPLLILLVIFKAFLSQRKYGYAITDRRLIIINERYENAVALVNIYDLQIEYGSEGTGTIVVRRMDNPYSRNESDKFDHFFIQGISEPDEAFRILSEALELAKKNSR